MQNNMMPGIRIYPKSIDDKLVIEDVLEDNDISYEYDRYEDCYFIPEAAHNCSRFELDILEMLMMLLVEFTQK